MVKLIFVLFLTLAILFCTSCSNKIGGSDISATKAPGKGQVLPDSSQLAVSLSPQLADEWCWAATGQMIMEFLGVTVSQCDEANKELNLTACCPASSADPVPGDCNRPGWPEFEKYGFEYSKTQNMAISWDELRRQISVQKSPVAFSWGWTGGSAEVVKNFETPAGIVY